MLMLGITALASSCTQRKSTIAKKATVQLAIADSAEAIQLGKALFNDTTLSQPPGVGCRTCHKPDQAFSGPSKLARSVPSLLNVRYQKQLFWDGGASDLESQAVASLTHRDEMGVDLKMMVSKLATSNKYKTLFQKAFHTDTVVTANALTAIASYERSLVSFSTRWDRKHSNTLGANIFQQECASCHTSPLFTDQRYYRVLPIKNNFDKRDFSTSAGRYRISRRASDWQAYKTPSLRNWARTAPYMHDGRYRTLRLCLEHGSHGPASAAAVHYGMPKTRYIAELVAFLECLNDTVIVR